MNRLDELANRLRKGFDRADNADIEWLEAKLDLAVIFAEARAEFPADIAFGMWLAENELDRVSHQDRAGLILMGQHPDLARRVMEETDRRSYRTIGEEIRDRFTRAGKPAPEEPHAAEPNGFASTTPETRHTAPAAEPNPEVISPPKVSTADTSRSPLRKWPKADLVLSHFLNAKARTELASIVKPREAKARMAVWDLLIASIECGAFGPPTQVIPSPSLRMVLPWLPPRDFYSTRYDLTKADHREIVRRDILPVVLEHRTHLMATPTDLPRLVNESYATRQQATKAVAQQVAVANLPTTERPVIAYGAMLWPQSDGSQRWSYDDVCEAAWFFDFVSRNLVAESPKAKSLQIRQILKWIKPAQSTGWSLAVYDIAIHYERNPDGPWDVPPPPANLRLE
jgi:hypothetical protein